MDKQDEGGRMKEIKSKKRGRAKVQKKKRELMQAVNMAYVDRVIEKFKAAT
jgi:hypothetical protein